MKPIVAIVGRPNVGKSTLFNRITGRRRAITLDEPGVTRDRNYADVDEAGRAFTLVDTGGFESSSSDAIMSQVRDETLLAVEEADVIILLMDGKTGPVTDDGELVGMLRKASKPVIYAVNKIDSARQETRVFDFYSLGVKEVMPLSAESGAGVNELIDAVVAGFAPGRIDEPIEEDRIRVAIVGRPNAGKSSLLNRLIGKKRAVVSEIAGTTRDPVDAALDRGGKKYLFVDTAGIRKKDKISAMVESYSVMAAIRAIERCDAAVLVIDALGGFSTQDEKIAGLIDASGKCSVIAVNKWDLAEKDSNTTARMTTELRYRAPFISYAPIVFVSALSGQRVGKILDTVDAVVQKAGERIKTSQLNEFIKACSSMQAPPVYNGREIKFYYVTQTGVMPPAFTVFTNIPEGVKDPYRRFLVNRLREAFGMDNCPVRVFFKKRH